MKIKNTKVYGLEESMIRSGFPMLSEMYTNIEFNYEIDNLSYWLNHDLLNIVMDEKKITIPDLSFYNIEQCFICNSPKGVRKLKEDGEYYCIKHMAQMKKYGCCVDSWYEKNKVIYNDTDVEIVLTNKNLDEIGRLIVSAEDYYKVSKYRWNLSNGHARNQKIGYIHRLLMDVDSNLVVDHIDGNGLNNKRDNLRVCNQGDNSKNRVNSAKKKILGVNFNKQKKKWVAQISNNSKLVYLGAFKTKEEAVKERLLMEKLLYKEFSSQQHLFSEYGIEPLATDIEKSTNSLLSFKKAYRHMKRAVSLASTNTSSGHGNYLSGISIQFNLTAPFYLWKQIQRYHFLQIVSSQSTMHRILKMDLKKVCNRFVLPSVIDYCEALQRIYLKDKTNENFQKLISNLPSGIEYSAGISTNYLQLKTIYQQRKNHKLEEWNYFCKWIESLPHSNLIINN